MQSPGFEPGSLTWQARIITKLYYDCLIDNFATSLLKRNDFFHILFNYNQLKKIMDKKIEKIMHEKIA